MCVYVQSCVRIALYLRSTKLIKDFLCDCIPEFDGVNDMNKFFSHASFALALAFGLGTAAQAATVNYTGSASLLDPFVTGVVVTEDDAGLYELTITSDGDDPFFILVDFPNLPDSTFGYEPGETTLIATIELDEGFYILGAGTAGVRPSRISVSLVEVAIVPLPAALPLLTSVLVGLGFAANRRRRVLAA